MVYVVDRIDPFHPLTPSFPQVAMSYGWTLDKNDMNPGLRTCEGIDGKGPYSRKEANGSVETHLASAEET